MIRQHQISNILGIHQSDVSRYLNGKKPVSWPLAAKLADLFPGRSIQQWKAASPDELKKAFSLLDIEKEVA